MQASRPLTPRRSSRCEAQCWRWGRLQLCMHQLLSPVPHPWHPYPLRSRLRGEVAQRRIHQGVRGASELLPARLPVSHWSSWV